jgi:AraC-like DNA-binding protein
MLGASTTDSDRADRQFVSSHDLEEVFANIPKWRIEHLLLSKPEGSSSSGMMRFHSLTVTSELFRGRVRALGSTPRGHFALGIDMAGAPGRHAGGRKLDADDALIGFDGAELDYVLPPGFLGLSFTMPYEVIEVALEERMGLSAGLTRFRSVRASKISHSDFPGWWQFFRRFTDTLHSNEISLAVPLLRPAFVESEIVDILVSIAGRHLVQENPKEASYWHHRRPVVRRAEEYMRANLSEPIMLHEICAAAKASERTVEYGFREMYGVGAKKFLQRLRLNRARRLFRTMGKQSLSIQDVAAASGFWHMGHFSTHYRHLFGETPSETVRSSQ